MTKSAQLYKQRQRDARLISYQRRKTREKLDGYGWVMSLDTVRTPEEILLVKERFARLERHIDNLQPRIARVMRLRLGINCKPQTFEEIAQAYGVTRERIRQMEGKGQRILTRRVWIEEKPEQYLREKANLAKVDAERRRAERAAEVEHLRQQAELADWSPPLEQTPVGVFRPRDASSGKFQSVRRERTILDEIVKEQKRALELEREQRRWAAEREAWLNSPMPSWVVDEPAPTYQYKLRKVPIKRDWLNVASEGFNDGA